MAAAGGRVTIAPRGILTEMSPVTGN